MDLQRYLALFLSVCVLHRIHLCRFVLALAFRESFFLRRMFFWSHAVLVLLLLRSCLLGPGQIGFVLHSVMAFPLVLVRLISLIPLSILYHGAYSCYVRVSIGIFPDVFLFLMSSFLLVRFCAGRYVQFSPLASVAAYSFSHCAHCHFSDSPSYITAPDAFS